MSTDPSPPSDSALRDLDLRVPPFPRTLPSVLELLHEPGFTDPEDLTEIVQHDPAATARLLKQINSAYYGLRRSISDVGRAIRMMGTTTAAGSVVSLGMLRMGRAGGRARRGLLPPVYPAQRGDGLSRQQPARPAVAGR
ncbi:HDOD domain-containing protein [Salinibacter ruber]|uniref:HDOD domain-containing protein n=1 Tax=Salinibacter ruber TaxID=146919 RepID=UPI0021CF818D|nr:HDOD domain-containing protein [Salinibacter ruber]